MYRIFAPLVLACSLLCLPSTALAAAWTWKKASNPTTANAEGLRVDGKIACKVVSGSNTYLGEVKNGVCEFRKESPTTAQNVAAPNYDFLAASGTVTSVEKLQLSSLPGTPSGVIRAALGEQGPVLCSIFGALGAVHQSSKTCLIPGTAAQAQGVYFVFVVTPSNGLVELPPLWRDLNTAGGTTGHLGFCRASITADGPKMAPGIFSPAGGGKCSFFVARDNSGAPIFSETTNKSRFLVLFPSSNSWEKLDFIGLNTDAILLLGVAGNEKVHACQTAALHAVPRFNGVFLQGRCIAPPAAGSGAGIELAGTVSYALNGIRLLSVFRN